MAGVCQAAGPSSRPKRKRRSFGLLSYRRVCGAALVIVAAATSASAYAPGGQEKHPIYVGVSVCTQCHAGPDSKHLFSQWRVSKHAQAYASLWSPEAKEIAKLSGIPEEPQRAAACLGCHVAGYDTEDWEKEDTFFVEDGIQCESCHGPGSEYIGADVMGDMMDLEKAKRFGLKIPGERECLACHNVKGSHVAVLQAPPVDIKKELASLCGLAPDPTSMPADPAVVGTSREPQRLQESPGAAGDEQHKYVGVMACAPCHQGLSSQASSPG